MDKMDLCLSDKLVFGNILTKCHFKVIINHIDITDAINIEKNTQARKVVFIRSF